MISIYHGVTEKDGRKREWYALKVNGVTVSFDTGRIVQAIGIEILAAIPIGKEVTI